MDNIVFNDVLMGDQPVRRPRTYRHRPSQLMDTYTEKGIRDRFRFKRRSIEFICDIVDEDLRRPTNRNHALSVEVQVLAGLRFLASGSSYQVGADVVGIDKSTLCRVVNKFCESLVSKKNCFIRFPFDDDKKKRNIN